MILSYLMWFWLVWLKFSSWQMSSILVNNSWHLEGIMVVERIIKFHMGCVIGDVFKDLFIGEISLLEASFTCWGDGQFNVQHRFSYIFLFRFLQAANLPIVFVRWTVDWITLISANLLLFYFSIDSIVIYLK